MAANPFFSGRIPQELKNKIDEFCEATGKSKTEFMVEAFYKYLDLPIPATENTPEVSKEMFLELQEKVNQNKEDISNLKDLLKIKSKQPVIKADNTGDDKLININNLPIFKSITTQEVAKHTNLKIRQINGIMGAAIQKAKSLGFTIEEKQLLEKPVEITYKKDEGINVDQIPYKLFYLGCNLEDKPIWDLIPSDNIDYHALSQNLTR